MLRVWVFRGALFTSAKRGEEGSFGRRQRIMPPPPSSPLIAGCLRRLPSSWLAAFSLTEIISYLPLAHTVVVTVPPPLSRATSSLHSRSTTALQQCHRLPSTRSNTAGAAVALHDSSFHGTAGCCLRATIARRLRTIAGHRAPLLSNVHNRSSMASPLQRLVTIVGHDALEKGFDDEDADEGRLKENRKNDSKALFILQQAKEFQSSSKVLAVKFQTLRSEFEALLMKGNETLQNFLSRVISIISQMRSYGEKITDAIIVSKVLRSLTPKYDYIVTAIEEAKGLSILSFDELMGSLQAHEARQNISVEKDEENEF
ncbi:hypothetical protein ZIOFF_000376 [Zingiber officinale]|uniref:Uncharacterized protein n=1 Tax=Zingiber officinale TaxID=94328 RepID=A0A8J5I4I0_ZINOF|nr:hypothetical protein ZIOFF_000376 [Zingiber officinale]